MQRQAIYEKSHEPMKSKVTIVNILENIHKKTQTEIEFSFFAGKIL